MDSELTNILVVDDLPEKILVYRTILGELGQNIVSAQSGAEALKRVLELDFAVILLDVNMPEMDGFETAALIRQRKKSAHTPIIFVTAFADEMRTAEGYAHGAVDYILTPVIPDILRAKVKVFVDLFRMARQIERQAEQRVALVEERSKREAAENANRRLHFLAEVSRRLADSLDPSASARTLARQAVPFLADLAFVTLADNGLRSGASEQSRENSLLTTERRPRSGGWNTELAWTDPESGEISTRHLTGADGLIKELRESVGRVLAGGQSELLEKLELNASVYTGGAQTLNTAIVAPLRARGRTLGVLTIGYGPSGRNYGPTELALAVDLASRAATALDNAQLFNDVQRADRQKNEFLSMLAHELRNPLAPIRYAVELQRVARSSDANLKWTGEVIERQVGHLARLVDDLLDVSRITSGKIRLQLEPVNLASIVKQAVEASQPEVNARQHALEVALPDRPVMVMGDSARLTQVLTNLLNNAAKYTDDGGRLSITVDVAEAAATVRVCDSGVGIPAEMLEEIFEPFAQVDRTLDRAQGGLGIGLTLVKRLVEMHGGTATARSGGLNQGSEFAIRLPLAADGSPSATGPTAREPQSMMDKADLRGVQTCSSEACAETLREERTVNGELRPRRHVLVVDDNVDGANSLATLLKLSGYFVHMAHDGQAAIQAAFAIAPDAVVLDIGLPGMDGYQVARQLRASRDMDRAILIAVTGYGGEEDRIKALEAGFDFHLVKPVDFPLLQRLLQDSPPKCEGLGGRG